MTAHEYFERDPEREEFYRTFYRICRQFNVTWSSASPEVKAFVEEATRVAYEQGKARRNGENLNTVKPFFGDEACWSHPPSRPPGRLFCVTGQLHRPRPCAILEP